MGKWINSDAIRGAELVMQLKEAAIKGGLDNPISEIVGCGVGVVTRYLDALLKDWIDKTSDLEDTKRERTYYRESVQEWRDLGFDKDPSEQSDERQQELQDLAQRWNDEDEAEMDAQDQKEIDERREKREARKAGAEDG